jgi:uncharacterized protein
LRVLRPLEGSAELAIFFVQVTREDTPLHSKRVGTTTVAIAYLTLELRIEGAHSLKDKRRVLRSLKDRLRGSFNVAISEIDSSELWQRATVGVVSISDSRDYLEGLMRNVERQAFKIANNCGAEVTDSFLDFL